MATQVPPGLKLQSANDENSIENFLREGDEDEETTLVSRNNNN